MINRVQNNQSINNTNLNHRINAGLEFGKVLENIQNGKDLKISSHAQDRLKERSINLTDKDMKNLKDAVDNIRVKGGREALILYNNTAFITSIRNNTIITALDKESMRENVFTNIDSAIIL